MTILARASLALALAALLSILPACPAHAHLVQDFGVRKGEPAHISLSTGFNGFVGAGIKKIAVDGRQMDAFCIEPFTLALRSSSGYRFVALTQAPEAPWTLSPHKATEISDLWAMFYSPNMKEKKAAGLQLAIWEIVGGDDFSVIGKDYGASLMLAALQHYSGPGANLIALTGPGQDYVVATPPGQRIEGRPTPTPTPRPTPRPTPTATSTPLSTPTPPPKPTPTATATPTPAPAGTPIPTTTPNPTPTPTPVPTIPVLATPNPTPPPKSVPDSGSTFLLFATSILVLLALNTSCVPALLRMRVRRDRMSVKRP